MTTILFVVYVLPVVAAIVIKGIDSYTKIKVAKLQSTTCKGNCQTIIRSDFQINVDGCCSVMSTPS